MSSEKELIDQYQSLLHIDDKTKQDAVQLYTQYLSKQPQAFVCRYDDR